jgi:hypothetical protein
MGTLSNKNYKLKLVKGLIVFERYVKLFVELNIQFVSIVNFRSVVVDSCVVVGVRKHWITWGGSINLNITHELLSFIVSFLENTAKNYQGNQKHGLENDNNNGNVWYFDL